MTSTDCEGSPFIRNHRPSNRRVGKAKYFFFGFFLSTLICFAALGLSHIVWEGYGSTIKPTEICEKMVVGFYRLWHEGELTETQLSKLTHVIFASFLYSEQEKKIIHGNDKEEPVFKAALEESKRFELIKMFSMRGLNLKMILNHRRRISEVITSFIDTHQLDGVDIEWVSPATPADWENLIKFCEKIRENLNRLAESSGRTRPFVISLQCPHSKPVGDFERLLKSVDFLNLDVTHYYEPWYRTEWNHLTGPASPLYSGHKMIGNVDDTLRHYSCLTKKPSRLVMMLAFSGRYWNKVIPPKEPKDTLWMVAEKINGTVEGSFLPWREMKRRWSVSRASWNDESKTPYIWDSKTRTQYHFENERSLREKVKYAIEKNIGGVGVWSTSEDDEEDTLLNVLAKGGLCPRKYDVSVKYNCTE